MSGYDKAPALYVGGGKVVERPGNEPYFRIELDLTDLRAKMTDDLIRVWHSKNGQKHEVINLVFAPLREPTQYKTHSLKIDTWKPDKYAKLENQPARSEAVSNVQKHFAPKEEVLGDDEAVPF